MRVPAVVVCSVLWSLLAAGGCGGGHPDFFSHCGNGVIDTPYEECDDGDLNDDNGSCLTTCLKARCGDGFLCSNPMVVPTPGVPPRCAPADVEQCDGFQLGGQTCRSLGFASGTLACGTNCMVDTSGCVAQANGTSSLRQGTENRQITRLQYERNDVITPAR
jgi:hypothetical protein